MLDIAYVAFYIIGERKSHSLHKLALDMARTATGYTCIIHPKATQQHFHKNTTHTLYSRMRALEMRKGVPEHQQQNQRLKLPFAPKALYIPTSPENRH